ncbi:L,D-transpeptidase family protein [Streptomyces sp. HC307]|uniref:L,D-transpeptidase family protein n=1 Tax=Streptomyces flavusporus TaxID=3385496 RepID=UPI00391760F6
MNTTENASRLGRVLAPAAIACTVLAFVAGTAYTPAEHSAQSTSPVTAKLTTATGGSSAHHGQHGTPLATRWNPLAARWPVVSRGQRGVRVTAVQSLLAARGHRLAADGVFGPATTNAVKAFQRAHRLAPDGTVGPKTWSALIFNLRPGSHGQAVTAAQRLLTGHGHPAAADGVFGPRTTAAVKAFQRDRHLAVDGVVGPNTWRALMATSAATPRPNAGGYYLLFSKNQHKPAASTLYIMRNGKAIKKYRAGSGVTTNPCASQKGWLPNGVYQITGHQKNRNSIIKGYAIGLSNKRCSPNGTLRSALFVHSEMAVNGGRGSSEPTQWNGEDDYKSLGCIKLSPPDIKDLFNRLDTVGWPKTLHVS